ncbi:MAG: HU family DNA-binding protein [Prevotellaceae bacterium]|jgi:predicted histone-like DNA-binding protein|nr:HU family DNA-binding protein [Prevotellaceae bacterium]
MKYKLRERRNPSNPAAPHTWHVSPITSGKANFKDFAKLLAEKTSLDPKEIEKVLYGFFDELPEVLKAGKNVKLGNFGSVRLTVSSKGVVNKEDFSESNVEAVRVIFAPSKELKQQLATTVLERE